MTIGEKIRERRKELHMSQTELAQKTGYADKSGISKVENGLVELGQSGILKFAAALEVDYRYLMDWTDQDGNERQAVTVAQVVPISDDDTALLRAFHAAPEYVQKTIRDLLHI